MDKGKIIFYCNLYANKQLYETLGYKRTSIQKMVRQNILHPFILYKNKYLYLQCEVLKILPKGQKHNKTSLAPKEKQQHSQSIIKIFQQSFILYPTSCINLLMAVYEQTVYDYIDMLVLYKLTGDKAINLQLKSLKEYILHSNHRYFLNIKNPERFINLANKRANSLVKSKR